MLVVSRRVNEEILFPNLGISVKVLRTTGNRIQLGVDAPRSIEVRRGELQADGVPGAGHAPVPVPPSRLPHDDLTFLADSLEIYHRQIERGDADGANSTFFAIIARLREADQAGAARVAASRTLSSTPRVLIVDDEANERELLAGLLRMDGCHVDTAEDGAQAIEMLETFVRPDVVLLDMHMPKLNGCETLNIIRRHKSLHDLIVYGVSGSSAQDYGVTVGEQGGFDEWFEKPLNPNLLVSHLHQRFPGSRSAV